MGRVRPLEISRIAEPLTLKEAVCFYDVQRRDYFADVDGETILRAERASDLERLTATALRRGAGLKWKRVLVREIPDPPKLRSRAADREGIFATAVIAFARGEVADRPDGVQLFRAWPPEELDDDLPAGLVPEDTRIVAALVPNLVTEVHVRPYSEGLYRAWCLFALVLSRASVMLADVKSPEDVRKGFDLRAFIAAMNVKPKIEE